jgi:hypothetical protein
MEFANIEPIKSDPWSLFYHTPPVFVGIQESLASHCEMLRPNIVIANIFHDQLHMFFQLKSLFPFFANSGASEQSFELKMHENLCRH